MKTCDMGSPAILCDPTFHMGNFTARVTLAVDTTVNREYGVMGLVLCV